MSGLSESKRYALELIERDAESVISEKGISNAMATAILKLVNHLRIHPESRWGRIPLTSDRNLSWIAAQTITPVMHSIITHNGSRATDYTSYHTNFNPASKPEHILEVENLVRILCRSVNPLTPEEGALNLLERSLQLLRAHFCPDPKSVRRDGDAPFCIYCYRDILPTNQSRPTWNACHLHSDKNGRAAGKKLLSRYKMIRKYLGEVQDRRVRHHFPLATSIIHEADNYRPWTGRQDDVSWISFALASLVDIPQGKYKHKESADCVCQVARINKLAEEIAQLSKRLETSAHDSVAYDPMASEKQRANYLRMILGDDYPIALYGTLLRYEAYQLARMLPPAKHIAKQLSKLWSGEKPIDVARTKDKLPNLLQTSRRWKDKIHFLMSKNVRGEVIKFSFGFSALPYPDRFAAGS